MAKVTLSVDGLLSFSKAARLLGVSRPTLYAYITKGKLHPITIGSNRFLLLEEIKAVKKK